MPDYDVGIVSLSSPPSLALVTPYRPAVSVRNNGIHDALASGVLRIYSAGRLIFTTELYSGTISPGASVPALASDYWTPPALGDYLVTADVSCPLDQFEPNNHLGPSLIQVIPGEPPPPSVVAPHASQHEDGGSDELEIDGLRGRLADPQTPLVHKSSHQAGGADQLDVSGLPGILAQGQPIADHHSSHEDGGGDELNVDELAGVLKYKQKPQIHDNAAHDPNYAIVPHNNSAHDPAYATQSALQSHLDDTTAVHVPATNLANRDTSGRQVGLVPQSQLADSSEASVPGDDPSRWGLLLGEPDQVGRRWGKTWPTNHASSHVGGGADALETADLATAQTDTSLVLAPNGAGGVQFRAEAVHFSHHLTHENGGADEISLAGLSGELADPQPAKAHNASHEHGGADEISIAGLSGNPASRGQANGLAPLGADSLVPSEFLPPAVPGENSVYTLLALHSLQIVNETGDHLIFGGLTTGTSLKPNSSVRVIITGYVDPHDESTYLQIKGKMSQGLTPTWLCSNTCLFGASPEHGQRFKYEARIHFRPDSLSSFTDTTTRDSVHSEGDSGLDWDQDEFTSWQWYAHLGIPLLQVHIFSRQFIVEQYE